MKMERLDDLQKYLDSLGEASGYVRYLSRSGVEEFACGDRLKEYPVEIGVWSESSRLSVHIRFLDGVWYVDETTAPKKYDKKDLNTFLSHIPGKRVKILQIWLDEEDPFCANLPVKRFVKNIFAGFE